jgi:tetratricopeptide (TPR) repeat protein
MVRLCALREDIVRIAILLLCASVMLIEDSSAFAMDGGTGAMFDGRSATPGFGDRATAARLLRDQRYAEAIPYLNKALLARPGDAGVLDDLAYAHRMIGDYPGSLLLCQHTLAKNPDRPTTHENLGEVYLKMNRLAGARAELVQLQRLCPTGCDEANALSVAIARYEQGAAAAPASAQPAVSGTASSVSPR